MGKGAKLDEHEVECKNRCRDHQPGHYPGKAGPGEGTEDEAYEPAGRTGEYLIDRFIDRLRRGRARQERQPNGGDSRYYFVILHFSCFLCWLGHDRAGDRYNLRHDSGNGPKDPHSKTAVTSTSDE